jgi:hypothetical protein
MPQNTVVLQAPKMQLTELINSENVGASHGFHISR